MGKGREGEGGGGEFWGRHIFLIKTLQQSVSNRSCKTIQIPIYRNHSLELSFINAQDNNSKFACLIDWIIGLNICVRENWLRRFGEGKIPRGRDDVIR